MAKYYSSTFGKISGKHGSAVAVIMKDGTTYLREYSKPSNPRTDKQQAHRAKFALSSKALVPFNPIFKKTMGITNGISIARSYAYKNAIVGEYPSFELDYKKLMFSFGPIEKLANASASFSEGYIYVKWDYNRMHNCHKNDSVSFIVFNKNTNQTIHIEDIAKRSDKSVKIHIHETWAEDDLCLWAYVTQGDKISDSVFVDKCVPVVGTDICVYPENNIVDNEQINSPTCFGINQAISTIILMLYNLFSLFKQVIEDTKTVIPANSLIYNVFTPLCCVDNSEVRRVLKPNYNGYRVAIFDVVRRMYQSIFMPGLIPIYCSSAKTIICKT